jgi:hypothetical protein
LLFDEVRPIDNNNNPNHILPESHPFIPAAYANKKDQMKAAYQEALGPGGILVE